MEDFEKIKGNPNFSIIGHMMQESEGISDHSSTKNSSKVGHDAMTGIKKKKAFIIYKCPSL
jgi:thiamine-monophosphate kinase